MRHHPPRLTPSATQPNPTPAQANLLEYAQQLAVAQAGSPVVDAVIAVPAFYSQAQRRALLDAAALAGLNVLGLVNAHSAAALAYGIERDFVNKTQHVVFYDVGAHSTQVTANGFAGSLGFCERGLFGCGLRQALRCRTAFA